MQMDNEDKKSSSSTAEVVEDIIEEEILRRLPVRSLLRLRCVSKSWRSLIDSKRFISKLHLQNSSTRRRVIANYCNGSFTYVRSSPSYLGLGEASSSVVDPSPIDDDPSHDHLRAGGVLVVGHCNGLLCIFKKDEQRFFLWNPATRISIKLPKILDDHDHGGDNNNNKRIFKYGFGWDVQSGAYKVFAGLSSDNGRGGDSERIARVYSSETDSWGAAVEYGQDHDLLLCWGIGVCAYGKIHWLRWNGWLESFDLEREVFVSTRTPMDQPCQPGGKDRVCPWLWVEEATQEGHLCVVCDANDHKTRTVRVMLLTNKKKNNNWVWKWEWVEDHQLTSQLGMLDIYGCFGAFSYVETLVSPPLLENKEKENKN